MPYTQCMYAPPDPSGMAQETREGENARIVCQDENGVIWHLSEDSEVGDWLRYEGEVLAFDEATMEAWTNPAEGKPA